MSPAKMRGFMRWTAIITLLSVVFGFAYTTFQLLGQRDDLHRIEQNFQNMNQLKKALMMPLEGVWDYRVKYATYIGEQNSKRYLDGKAVAIWYGDTANIGYHFYIGGGVYEIGRSGNPDVTLVIEVFLPTGKNGIPKAAYCVVPGAPISSGLSDFE